MTPKVVLITGAGSGIGAALAVAYAEPGVRLCLLGRNRENLETVAGGCRNHGAEVEILQADVCSVDALRQTLLKFDDKNPIDLLIASAGVTSGIAPGKTVEDWQGILSVAQTNFLGVLATVSAISERMVKRQAGQIAIMGSLSAYRGLPSCPAYSGAKAGIEAYGMALRAGLCAENVHVSIISPGFVDTAMSNKLTGMKLFVISPQRAAEIIHKGLASNRARISFPFPLNFGARILALLPDRLARLVLPFFKFNVMR